VEGRRVTLGNPRSVFTTPLCETLSNSRSLIEAFGRCAVGVSRQQEMVVRILLSQGIKTNLAFGQIDIGADQAVTPDRADVELVSQHDGLPLGVGFSDIDHGSGQRLLQVQSPVFGERSAIGGIFDANCVALPMGSHEAVRLNHQVLAIAPR
jgi:hypothetical protein